MDPNSAEYLNGRPVHIDGLAFFDECHRKIELGHSSKIERRVSTNEFGTVCRPRDGGTFGPEHPKTKV